MSGPPMGCEGKGHDADLPAAWPEGLAILGRTPRVLRDWLGAVPAEWLDANEGGDSFSPREVVAHLVQGECEDWMPRVRRLLEHGESRAFDPFDPEGFRSEGERPLAELLDELEARRAANLADLEALGLSPEDLERRGTHPEFGSVTLGELLSTWVAHDLAHMAQIARVLTHSLGPRIGPWRAFFSRLRGS